MCVYSSFSLQHCTWNLASQPGYWDLKIASVNIRACFVCRCLLEQDERNKNESQLKVMLFLPMLTLSFLAKFLVLQIIAVGKHQMVLYEYFQLINWHAFQFETSGGVASPPTASKSFLFYTAVRKRFHVRIHKGIIKVLIEYSFIVYDCALLSQMALLIAWTQTAVSRAPANRIHCAEAHAILYKSSSRASHLPRKSGPSTTEWRC